jgi:hypothetical protein
MKSEITKAVDLLRIRQLQLRHGKQKRIDWDEIASACLPAWGEMGDARSEAVT